MARRSFTFWYFLSTPVNISRIRPSLLLQDCLGRIHLMALLLPTTEGLTTGAECTADIPIEMTFPLKKAMDGMEKPFQSLLGQLSPDFLIHNFVQYWAQTAAAEMSFPAIYFSVLTPAACGHILHPCKLRNNGLTAEELAGPPFGFPSSAITLRLYEARDLLFMYRGIPGHIPPSYRMAKCLDGCVVVIVKSCFEYEDKYIRYFHDAIGVPVLSVGPLISVDQAGGISSERSDLLEWLDQQRAASIMFVSFGSEAFLSADQIHKLALGLEASGLSFLWCLRFPCYSDSGRVDPTVLLPRGFETRTRDRGLVVHGWVLQVHILLHASVGGFVSHAGWISTMESLSFGIPLTLLPLHGDQGSNSQQIAAESEAGIEIERGDDGSFRRERISTTLTMEMAGEEGQKLILKVAEARDIIAANKKSSIHDFIENLEHLGEEYKKKKSMS